MSNPDPGASLTFEDIRSGVCSTVTSITKKVPKKICSHFNVIPLRLSQVVKYCDWNYEIELWERPLPASVKGLMIYEQGMFILVHNAKNKNPLIRVKTILHELGHYILHRRFLESGVCARAGSEWFDDQSEKEANLFALMAMVPDKEVGAICDKHGGIEDCARYLEHEYSFTDEEAIVRIAAYDRLLRWNSYRGMFDQYFGNP